MTAKRSWTPWMAFALVTVMVIAVGATVSAHLVTATRPSVVVAAIARRRYTPPAGATAFPAHRAGGYGGMLALLGMVMTVEAVGLHLLVSRWQPTIAWVLTALTVLSMVWLVGDYHGLRLNPHVLDARTLHVRVGLRWRTDLPVTAIRAVRRYRETRDHDVLRLAPMGEPAVVIELDRPVTVDGMFGLRRETDALAITADDAPALLAALTGDRPPG